MKNIGEIIEIFIHSNIERAKVRPFWEQKEKILNAYIFWEKQKNYEIENKEFEIQIHRFYPKLKRLLHLPSRKLIGYGLDEQFLVNELYELYSKKDGFVDLNRKINKIAHISDLHILWNGFQTKEGHIVDDDILDKIVVSLKRENPDLIVVTGDITDDGLGYMKFYKAFKYFINRGMVIVIPGNHDLNPLGASVFASGFKIADYKEFARIIMGKRKYIDNFIFEFDNLIIMGTNSNAGINKNILDNAVGYVDLRRDEALTRLIANMSQGSASGNMSQGSALTVRKNNKKKIFLMHHHLEKIEHGILGKISPEIEDFIDNFMKLENAKEVSSFCKKNNINLLLHGHKHISYEKNSSINDKMQIFGAPSTTINKGYHIISEKDNGFIRKEVFY